MVDVVAQLGSEAPFLLEHRCSGIPRELLQLPGADYVDRVVAPKDRSPTVLRNLQLLFNTGRLGGTGYLSHLSTRGSEFMMSRVAPSF